MAVKGLISALGRKDIETIVYADKIAKRSFEGFGSL